MASDVDLDEIYHDGPRQFIRFHTVGRGDEHAVPCGLEVLRSFARFRQRVSDHLGIAIDHPSQHEPTPWRCSQSWLNAVRALYWDALTREAKARQHQARDEFVATLCQALAE
jgi:hypothetical protein